MYLLSEIDALVAKEQASPETFHAAREFLREFNRTSLFLPDNADELHELYKHIQSLNPALQALWAEVIKTCLIRTSASDRLPCGCRVLHGRPCSDRSSSLTTGATSCSGCGKLTGPWDQYAAGQVIQNVLAGRTSAIAAGSARHDVFLDRFAPLVAATEEVVVIDRYAGARAVKKQDASGLARVLSLVWDVKPVDVILLTATKPGGNTSIGAAQIEAACADVVRKNGANQRGTLGLWTAPDRDFARHAHDRYVSTVVANRSLAISLGKGLEVFESSHVTQACSAQLLVDDSTVTTTFGRLRYNRNQCVDL